MNKPMNKPLTWAQHRQQRLRRVDATFFYASCNSLFYTFALTLYLFFAAIK